LRARYKKDGNYRKVNIVFSKLNQFSFPSYPINFWAENKSPKREWNYPYNSLPLLKKISNKSKYQSLYYTTNFSLIYFFHPNPFSHTHCNCCHAQHQD